MLLAVLRTAIAQKDAQKHGRATFKGIFGRRKRKTSKCRELEIYDDADRRIVIANTTAKTRTYDDIVLAASEETDGTREDRSGH